MRIGRLPRARTIPRTRWTARRQALC